MSDHGIFLERSDSELIVLRERPYDTEDLLQEALANHPEVLAGGTTSGEGEARRLLLVQREMGVAKAEGASATWSLDHLFISDDAIPVVVEVKRSSNTEIRRTVVGQMLDYAANGVVYWPLADIRSAVEARYGVEPAPGEAPLPHHDDPEGFWRRVESNLRSGRVRMVFVADRLPSELIRIIEFMNEQMSPAEVLGVEVPQYTSDDGLRVFVPRVVGRTQAAVAAKDATPGPSWDRGLMVEAVRDRDGDAIASTFERLLAHHAAYGSRANWGRSAAPYVSCFYRVADRDVSTWAGYGTAPTGGGRPYIYLQLPELKKHLAPDHFDRMIAELESIECYRPKVAEARREDFATKWPSVFLADIADRPADVDALIRALDIVASATSA